MKALFVIPSTEQNPFAKEIAERLGNSCQVTLDLIPFLEKKGDFDIIHIHWPEALTNWRLPSDLILNDLQSNILPYWMEKSKIVVTRHNFLPHYNSGLPFQSLYNLIYSASNAVIHMGQFSRDDYKETYKDQPWLNNQVHAVIPHGMYESFPDQVTKEEARKHFRIGMNKSVILVFGSFRNREEISLALGAFKNLPIEEKILLVSRWRGFTKPSIRTPINRLKWEVEDLLRKFNPKIILNKKFVPSEDVQFFFNASDIVFIPRLRGLNSGNIPLSFAFRKVVVGPTIGNLTELLSGTGNPTFDPFDFSSASRALSCGIELAKRGQGEENYNYGKKNWSIKDVASLHLKLYNSILN